MRFSSCFTPFLSEIPSTFLFSDTLWYYAGKAAKKLKKVILIPDSFKGTITSQEVCSIMEKVIHELDTNIETIKLPVADGGEGSVDCFLQAVGGEKQYLRVTGVFGEDFEGYYGILNGGETAVVEMAACAGLPQAEGRLNPELATTYGVGQLILDAADKGVKRIIVGLGGSASNDAGCGAAAATGIAFKNAAGESFIPCGGTLKHIAEIDVSGMDKRLSGVEIITMCDIDNPMYGENGAAYVFGPQKGADAEMLVRLDNGLRHLNEVFKRDLGKDFSRLPGGGAAGAMGAGMAAFFRSRLQMGIDTVLDTVRFSQYLKGADMVFTGEGRIDGQSIRGKVVIGVARRAAQYKLPVIAIVGDICDGAQEAYPLGVTAMFSTNTVAGDFSRTRHRAKENLAITMGNVMRLALYRPEKG